MSILSDLSEVILFQCPFCLSLVRSPAQYVSHVVHRIPMSWGGRGRGCKWMCVWHGEVGGGGGYDYFQYIYSPYLLLAYGSLFAGNVSTSVSEGVCCCVILSMPGTAGGGGGGGGGWWGGKDGVVRRSPCMSTSSGCPLVLPQYMQLLLQKRQVSKFAHCITILQTELNRHS